jgi:hypothetical protein
MIKCMILIRIFETKILKQIKESQPFMPVAVFYLLEKKGFRPRNLLSL